MQKSNMFLYFHILTMKHWKTRKKQNSTIYNSTKVHEMLSYISNTICTRSVYRKSKNTDKGNQRKQNEMEKYTVFID